MLTLFFSGALIVLISLALVQTVQLIINPGMVLRGLQDGPVWAEIP
jgi:hypothetical protein